MGVSSSWNLITKTQKKRWLKISLPIYPCLSYVVKYLFKNSGLEFDIGQSSDPDPV